MNRISHDELDREVADRIEALVRNAAIETEKATGVSLATFASVFSPVKTPSTKINEVRSKILPKVK